MTYMIKAGAKLPPRRTPAPKYPFAAIKVGQSFFVPGMTTKNFTSYAGRMGRKLDRKFSTQHTYMRQDLQSSEWEPCNEGDAGARPGVAVTRKS